MLSAELLPPVKGVWRQPSTLLHRLVVWTFRRSPNNAACWHPRQVRSITASRGGLQQAATWQPCVGGACCAVNGVPWPCVQLVLETAAEGTLREWLLRINAAIAAQARRQAAIAWGSALVVCAKLLKMLHTAALGHAAP